MNWSILVNIMLLFQIFSKLQLPIIFCFNFYHKNMTFQALPSIIYYFFYLQTFVPTHFFVLNNFPQVYFSIQSNIAHYSSLGFSYMSYYFFSDFSICSFSLSLNCCKASTLNYGTWPLLWVTIYCYVFFLILSVFLIFENFHSFWSTSDLQLHWWII